MLERSRLLQRFVESDRVRRELRQIGQASLDPHTDVMAVTITALVQASGCPSPYALSHLAGGEHSKTVNVCGQGSVEAQRVAHFGQVGRGIANQRLVAEIREASSATNSNHADRSTTYTETQLKAARARIAWSTD